MFGGLVLGSLALIGERLLPKPRNRAIAALIPNSWIRQILDQLGHDDASNTAPTTNHLDIPGNMESGLNPVGSPRGSPRNLGPERLQKQESPCVSDKES